MTNQEQHFDDCTRPKLATWQGSKGDLMNHCLACGRVSIAEARTAAFKPPEPAPQAEETGRYWLGCAKCGASMWLPSQRPRIPICQTCRDHERWRAA